MQRYPQRCTQVAGPFTKRMSDSPVRAAHPVRVERGEAREHIVAAAGTKKVTMGRLGDHTASVALVGAGP